MPSPFFFTLRPRHVVEQDTVMTTSVYIIGDLSEKGARGGGGRAPPRLLAESQWCLTNFNPCTRKSEIARKMHKDAPFSGGNTPEILLEKAYPVSITSYHTLPIRSHATI